jgi:hypothetical protein
VALADLDPELDGLPLCIPSGGLGKGEEQTQSQAISLWRPMQPCANPRHRLILSYLKHAASCLDAVTRAPPGDECARKSRVGEIDRSGVVEHSTRP